MAVLYLRDGDLIEGLKNKDDGAFERLLDIYGDRLLRVCFLILKDLPSAEDVVQEVFIQIYKSINKFKGASSLYTWIYRIAVNRCRDIYRKRNDYAPIDEDFDMVSDVDIEYEVVEGAEREKIKRIVSSMQPIYREVITLFYFEDLSIKEICDIFGESEGTVKSKLYRARNILKEALVREEICYGKR